MHVRGRLSARGHANSKSCEVQPRSSRQSGCRFDFDPQVIAVAEEMLLHRLDRFYRAEATGQALRSSDASKQIARLAQYRLRLPTFLNAVTRIWPMLKCVLVPARWARSTSPAVHPATLSSMNGRRVTGLPRSRLCSTAWTRAHRARITRMIRNHLCCSNRDFPWRFRLFTAA